MQIYLEGYGIVKIYCSPSGESRLQKISIIKFYTFHITLICNTNSGRVPSAKLVRRIPSTILMEN